MEQEQMLAGLRERARKAGLFKRIQLCRITPDELGVDEPVDFALAFWWEYLAPGLQVTGQREGSHEIL